MPSNVSIVDGNLRWFSSVKSSNGDYVECAKIIIIISGISKFDYPGCATGIRSDKNYFSLGEKLRRNQTKSLLSVVFPGSAPSGALRNSFLSSQYVNIGFFSEICDEIALTIHHIQKRAHLEAFLRIYRILESISIVFPLIYVTRTRSFRDANKLLKDYASEKGSVAGPLNFLAHFVKSRKNLTDEIEYPNLDVVVAGQSTSYREFCFSEIKRVSNQHKSKIAYDEEQLSLSIPFDEFLEFFISIRNKLFHDMRAQSNLNLRQLYDCDVFLSPLIEPAMQFLSIIIADIIRWNVNKY